MGLHNRVLNNLDKERVDLQRRLALAEDRNDILTRALVLAHHENHALGLAVRGLCYQLRERDTQQEKRNSFDIIWRSRAKSAIAGGIAAGVLIAIIALTSLALFAPNA